MVCEATAWTTTGESISPPSYAGLLLTYAEIDTLQGFQDLLPGLGPGKSAQISTKCLRAKGNQ
jgi:hypothetical protein